MDNGYPQGENDFLVSNGDIFEDRYQNFERSDKLCKKRLSGNHLSGETERRSKKSKHSPSDNSTGFVGTMTSYVSKEPVKSKREWAQFKSPLSQENSRKKNGARGGCRMEVLLSAPSGLDFSEDGKGGFVAASARNNILSWLIRAGALVKDQKLFYLHKGKKHLGHGWVTNEGVLCGCCNDIFSLSYFEEHCGSRLHRPCQNIFVDGGKSLTELQMEVFQKENNFLGSGVHFKSGYGKRRRSAKEKGKVEGDGSDDTCGVCGDGGVLICCDHCPSTYHLACMEMLEVPADNWYCPNCRCAICDGSQFNGDQSVFNDLTVLFCDQCEREFHVKCLYERGFPKMDECPQGSWFCGPSCTEIYQSLRGLVGVTNSLLSVSSGFSWTLLRSQAEDSNLKSEGDKELMAEHNIKLSMALSVMQECFKPMIDPRTNVDLVTHVLYNRGSDVSRLNYRGFYTMILEKEDELVSVATIRVHGNLLAEMPLIGTRYQYRRRGMCRRLMYAIEQMLNRIGVELLVLPAVPELMDTWRGAFGFQPLNSHQKKELTKLNLMAFPGTSLLHKFLPRYEPHSVFGGHSMFGSDFFASSPPHEVTIKRELIHNQHNGAQLDRYCENGHTPRQKSEENLYSTRVVVGTTRSKRLVKTTQWVAEAMNKLAGRSSSPADGAGTKLCVDRQSTVGTHQAGTPSMSNGKTSDSPRAMSCMEDANGVEPKKIILRINLSKLKEKKEKKKKKKDKYQRFSSHEELLKAETSYPAMGAAPIQPFDSKAYRAMYGGVPPLTESQILLMPEGDPERCQFVPQVDFRDLEQSPTICGPLTRLESLDAEYVDIVPALDVGCHLLPLLRHRTRLLKPFPPR